MADYVTPDIWQAINDAEMYRKGLGPVKGGTLDQVDSFNIACRMIWAEEAYWKAKIKARNPFSMD